MWEQSSFAGLVFGGVLEFQDSGVWGDGVVEGFESQATPSA